METKLIARVNNVDIIATSDEQMIPIRPICEALGIDPNGQMQRIKRDDILKSVFCFIYSTGKDGKTYEMFAIPYMYVFGWLFSINIPRINTEATNKVIECKKECYTVLFEHLISRRNSININF